MKTFIKGYNATLSSITKVVTFIMGCSVVAIFLMVIIQVFFRYVLRKSLGGMEELPVYIMAVCAWLSAPVTTIANNHVSIDLIPNLFKGRARICFTIFAQLVAFLSMAFFAKLAIDYVKIVFDYGEVTGGVGIPIWVFHGIIALGATLTSFFSLTNLISNVGRVIKWQDS